MLLPEVYPALADGVIPRVRCTKLRNVDPNPAAQLGVRHDRLRSRDRGGASDPSTVANAARVHE